MPRLTSVQTQEPAPLLGIEVQLRAAADAQGGITGAAAYSHVVIGLLSPNDTGGRGG